jgi:hypothetical protein
MTFNNYAFSLRSAPVSDPAHEPVRCSFKIAKSDDERQFIFGWASVAKRADGETVVDWQDDIIEIGELEGAAYDYVLKSRDGGEMHRRGGVAKLIESVVITKEKQAALGVPDGVLPEGWWVGFHVTDNDVWKKVKDGTYMMFSIQGSAIRENAG